MTRRWPVRDQAWPFDWKIFFADGSTLRSDQVIRDTNGNLQIPPFPGVVAIANVDLRLCGFWLAFRDNWYYLVQGLEWWGGDWDGLRNHLAFNIGTTAALAGEMIATPTWDQFWILIDQDPDLPTKSAMAPRERPWPNGHPLWSRKG